MKIGRWLTVIIGAAVGSLFAVWWVRNRGVAMLPSGIQQESGDTTDWLTLN